MIITQAEKRLNRKVTVAGDIELKIGWNMSPHIILHKVYVANAPWAAKPYFLTVDEFEVHFNLVNILDKQLDITYIHLVKPKLNLESNDKQHNWDFLDSKATPSSDFTVTLDKIKMNQAIIVYNDDSFKIDKFDLSAHDSNTKFHLQLQGKHHEHDIKLTCDIENDSKELHVNISHLLTGESDLTGELLVKKDPLKVTGKFKANVLQLNDFAVGAPSENGEYTIPDTPFDVEKIRNATFDVSIKFDLLDIGGIDLKKVTLNIKNINNVLNINLSPAAIIADGKLNLDIKYDLKPKVPTFNMQIKTTTLQLSKVLEQMFAKSPISGSSLDFKANLQGQGNNLKDIVNTLSGQILAVAGPGSFLNATPSLGSVFTSALSSVITFDKKQSSTAFKCGVMNFRVNKGIATANNGIGIEAASVHVLGNGMIDLRNGRIEFSMVPQNITANPIDLTSFSVAQLVTIKGTISKPVMTLNPTNLLKQSATAIISAGIAGSTGGLSAILAGGSAALLNKSTGGTDSNTASPCQTAISSYQQ